MAQEELTQQQLTEEQKAKAINLGGLMAHLDEFRQEHVDNKVDKETGKGLSHNDLTDSLLQKLNGLQNYDDTTVRALIAAVASDLQTYYYQKTDTYSQTEIDQRLSAIPKFGIEIVQTLPLTVEDQVQANFDEDDIETPQSDKVYMVPDTNAQSPNMYTEYLYIEDDDDFEMLGTQRLDLSGYSTTQQMNAAIAAAIANMPTMSATAVTAANAGNKTFFVGEQGNDGKWILQPMSQTEMAKIAYNYMKTSAIAAEYASVLGAFDAITVVCNAIGSYGANEYLLGQCSLNQNNNIFLYFYTQGTNASNMTVKIGVVHIGAYTLMEDVEIAKTGDAAIRFDVADNKLNIYGIRATTLKVYRIA